MAAGPKAPFRVTLRVRGGEEEEEGGGGEEVVWCRIVQQPSPAAPASAASDEAATAASLSAVPAWVPEATAREWAAQLGVDVSFPPVLQEAWAGKVAVAEAEAGRVEGAFEQYRARAHAALKKATERSGEERARDRLLEEEVARVGEEKAYLERALGEAEERVAGLQREVEEAREENGRVLAAVEHEWGGRVAEARREEAERAAEAAARAGEDHRKEVAVLVRLGVESSG